MNISSLYPRECIIWRKNINRSCSLSQEISQCANPNETSCSVIIWARMFSKSHLFFLFIQFKADLDTHSIRVLLLNQILLFLIYVFNGFVSRTHALRIQQYERIFPFVLVRSVQINQFSHHVPRSKIVYANRDDTEKKIMHVTSGGRRVMFQQSEYAHLIRIDTSNHAVHTEGSWASCARELRNDATRMFTF